MLFSSNGALRHRWAPRRPAPKLRQRIALRLEALEDRVLFALGNPAWLSQGPTAITDSEGLLQNGAIQSVALDPTNPDRMFAATVDGGIWRTTNATSGSPSWTPLTDQLTFLGMTDIEFDPADTTRNTLWTGTGQFSN